jgi:hypothetical protein
MPECGLLVFFINPTFVKVIEDVDLKDISPQSSKRSFAESVWHHKSNNEIYMIQSSVKKRRPRKNQFVIKHGALPPAAQVMHFSDEQWENFIEIACCNRNLTNGKYVQIKRLGNAGDAGRDVEARLTDELKENSWDLYQAKHYETRLAPSTAFPELVKFFGHLKNKTYPCPRNYYFCAPRNAGPDLHDLIASPINFKKEFLKAWSNGTNGLKNFVSLLTPEMHNLVSNFDFSRIKECLVRDLIKWHSEDAKEHHKLFGIEPERGDDPDVPSSPTTDEMVYITELLKVYSEFSKANISLADVEALEDFRDQFAGIRANFYCAEGLKRFSRDLYTEDEFGNLLTMVLNGIRPIVSSPRHKVGLDRLDAAMSAVSSLTVIESKLYPRMRAGDLPGTCHHLVNEKRLSWVK